jgi:hypothetical protein
VERFDRFVCAIALTLTACRADVAGWWTGDIGGTKTTLSLDQAGGVIDGEACMAHACDTIDDGTLEEESLLLTFGCADCALPHTTLDLVLTHSALEGEAYVWDCGCRREVVLHRCRGPC